MSLQTNVFENGRWVTRNIDPYQARAQNTEPQHKQKSAASPLDLEKPPSFGLISHTLIRSSVIKWIIPARLRHESKNDVLFITAGSIAIKEAFGDYTLKDVTIKTDFDSPIRSARIIGDPRELADPDIYAHKQRRVRRWNYHDHQDLPKPLYDVPQHTQNIPPHIAVLALKSDKLVFLCVTSGISDQIQYLCCQKELPSSQSPLERLGEHIAVDSSSRAMAVAAQEGHVYVYTLKSMATMRQEFSETGQFSPITEERLLPDIPVGGSILKMEFLHPSQNDQDQIILLLIISRNGKTRMFWYEWNSRVSLLQSQLRATVQGSAQDEQLPLLLIPLKHSTAFMIVCEMRIALYKNILTGTPTRYIQRLEEVRDPEALKSSGRPPVWVQWARPLRRLTATFTADHDGIFLCREDGIVQYLTLLSVEHMLDSTHKAGRLGINVDTAFAVLDVGPTKVDLFIAGGDMCEGGLWRSEPREDPKNLASIPNCAPLNDFVVTSAPTKPLKVVGTLTTADRQIDGQQRMFACTGRGRHGAITELRYGYAAPRKLSKIDLSDQVNRDVLSVWAFHGFFGGAERRYEFRERLKDCTYILISCPTRTLLWRMPLEGSATPVDVDLGLEHNARTIAASSTRRGLIQITEYSIRTATLPVPQLVGDSEEEQEQEYQQEQAIKCEDQEDTKMGFDGYAVGARYCYNFEDSRVVAACTYSDLDTSLILLAVQKAEIFYLQLGHMVIEYTPLKTLPLSSQPSTLLLKGFGDHMLAFVGDLDGELQIILTDNIGSRFNLVSKYKFQGLYAICDSLTIMISSDEEREQIRHLVVCGLRNGSLHTLSLGAGPSYTLNILEELNIGYTSVTVLSDVTRRARTVVHCEDILATLEYDKENGRAAIRRILVTDFDEPELQIGSLSAISQAVDSWVPDSVPGFTAGFLFCVDGNELHTVSIDRSLEPEMVPRRLLIGGSPVRVIYSAHLKRLIVLYTQATIPTRIKQHNGGRNTRGKRVLRPRVAFRDPDKASNIQPAPDEMDVEPNLKPDDNDALLDLEHKPGERPVGITEWFPRVDGNEYYMLVINTMLTRANKQTGRLLFFAISQGAGNSFKLAIKKRLELDAPVYSVAAYSDGKSIVYCSGSELCIQSLDHGPSGIKWQPPIKAAMRSPARHITIAEPLIYVSSTRESLAVYRYEAGRLVYQYGDQSARDGIHHIRLPEHSLVLASDISNTVVGLWQPPGRRIDNAMSTVFEATLPMSITKLRLMTKPAWYHHSSTEERNGSIIGCSADGTLTQFDILAKGWKVLRFIQNMAERSPLVCPFAGKRAYKRRVEPSNARPHFMHVNGDIIKRALDRGGESCLRDMLDVEPDLETHTDFDSVEDRWARFRQLAAELVDIEDEHWLTNLVQLVKLRLASAF